MPSLTYADICLFFSKKPAVIMLTNVLAWCCI